MNVGKFLYVIAGLMHPACFSFATHELNCWSPNIGRKDTSISLHKSIRFIHKTNERKLNSPCKAFAFNGGVGIPSYLRDIDHYSAIDGSGQSLLEYCSLNDCCTGGSGQECRGWSPNPQVTYEMCPSSCHGDDSCTGIAGDCADSGSVVSIQSGSCHGEGSCHRIAKNSPQVLSVRIEENSCLGKESCRGIGGDNESTLERVHIGPFSCTKDFSCNYAGAGFNSQIAFQVGVIIPENECNSHIGSCKNCAKYTLFTGTQVITETCCSAVSDEGEYQHFDTACYETNAPSISVMPSYAPSISGMPSNSSVPSSSPSLRKLNSPCKAFAFNGGVGSNPLRDIDDYSAIDGSGQSLLEYCLWNDCCTGGSFGQECRDWSNDPQVTYEMCPSSCHGDDSCTGIAKVSAAGTVVSIQSGSCQGEGSCHRIAHSGSQVLSVRIEENSCLGEDSCNGIGAENRFALKRVHIGPFSCTKDFSCDSAGEGTRSKIAFQTGVIIPENECNSHIGSCKNCAKYTLFTGTLVITETCCSAVSDEEQYQHFDTACYETNAPSISVTPSISLVPSSSPSLSIKPSLSTMPSTRFNPSALPSLYPSSIPSEQIDCTAVTHYYHDAGMDTPQSDRGSISPLTDHACSDPDQNYMVDTFDKVYRYGPTCCIFDYDTQQCGIWENYSDHEGEFLHPCSFGPIDASEEPSLFPSHEFSSKPSLLLSTSPSIAKSNNPSSSSRPSSVPSLSQSLEPSQVPSSSPSITKSLVPSQLPSSFPSITKSSVPSQLPSVSPSILSSSNPTSIASASECENANEAPFDIEIKLNNEVHDNVIKIKKYETSTGRFSKRIFRKGKKKFDTAYTTYNWRVCLDKSECYRFVIRDLGDANGFISGDEMAYVKLHWDGQKIKRSRFRYNLKRMRKKFGSCFGDSGNIFT